MHGLTQSEAVAAMRAVKAALGGESDIAFAMSTATNLDWPLSELVEHVREEHETMKAKKPGQA